MNADTALLAIKALDGLSARSVATAENIANAATPGYRPLRVSFEDALKQAAGQGPDALQALSFAATPDTGAHGEVRIDQEMASASATALRYGALVEALSRELAMDSLVVQGNR
jgi:flagellar basal-body rod protein FlgB